MSGMANTWSRKRRPASVRFWEKVNKDGPMPRDTSLGVCWSWTAATDRKGYGQFGTGEGKKVVKAYRWAWEEAGGVHSPGMNLDHLCRNRNCVRPSHLELVTHRENLIRGETIPALNTVKTHCPRGHAYAGKNLYVDAKRGRRHCRECFKLNQRIDPDNPRVVHLGTAKKAEIRARYAAGGITQVELAKKYGIHRVTVSNIIRKG